MDNCDTLPLVPIASGTSEVAAAKHVLPENGVQGGSQMPLCAAAEEPEASVSSPNPEVSEAAPCTVAEEVKETPTPTLSEVVPAEARGKKVKKKLIVPPGHDVVIAQKKVNIFDTEIVKQLSWQEDDGAKEVPKNTQEDEKEAEIEKGQRTLRELNLHNTGWKEAEAPKHRRQVMENAVLLDAQKANAILEPPEGWGVDAYLDPSVQEPPKKRGRKPKQEEEKVVQEPKKGKKAKKDTPPENSEEPEGSTPNERLTEYFREQKKKKVEADEKAEADNKKDASENGKQAKSKAKALPRKKPEDKSSDKSEVPERKDKHGRDEKDCNDEEKDSKKQRSAAAKGRKRKTTEKADEEPKSKSRKGKQTTPTEEPEMNEEEKAALDKKARLSRKSAAYHYAYRHTEGSADDKKAAAKKAFWTHYLYRCLNAMTASN